MCYNTGENDYQKKGGVSKLPPEQLKSHPVRSLNPVQDVMITSG